VIRYQITNGRYSADPAAWFRSLRDDVDFLQIRERDLSARELAALTRRVVSQLRTKVLVNDRIDVAIACGAAGVHLRARSISPARVKALQPMIVTVACHDLSDPALIDGADFALLAPIFPPLSKDADRPPLGLTALAEFTRATPVPVIALGGVTPENAPACLAAGAIGIAGITLFS
jgi:thiamine-phosphate pyrophosphorylase